MIIWCTFLELNLVVDQMFFERSEVFEEPQWIGLRQTVWLSRRVFCTEVTIATAECYGWLLWRPKLFSRGRTRVSQWAVLFDGRFLFAARVSSFPWALALGLESIVCSYYFCFRLSKATLTARFRWFLSLEIWFDRCCIFLSSSMASVSSSILNLESTQFSIALVNS